MGTLDHERSFSGPEVRAGKGEGTACGSPAGTPVSNSQFDCASIQAGSPLQRQELDLQEVISQLQAENGFLREQLATSRGSEAQAHMKADQIPRLQSEIFDLQRRLHSAQRMVAAAEEG